MKENWTIEAVVRLCAATNSSPDDPPDDSWRVGVGQSLGLAHCIEVHAPARASEVASPFSELGFLLVWGEPSPAVTLVGQNSPKDIFTWQVLAQSPFTPPVGLESGT